MNLNGVGVYLEKSYITYQTHNTPVTSENKMTFNAQQPLTTLYIWMRRKAEELQI